MGLEPCQSANAGGGLPSVRKPGDHVFHRPATTWNRPAGRPPNPEPRVLYIDFKMQHPVTCGDSP